MTPCTNDDPNPSRERLQQLFTFPASLSHDLSWLRSRSGWCSFLRPMMRPSQQRFKIREILGIRLPGAGGILDFHSIHA